MVEWGKNGLENQKDLYKLRVGGVRFQKQAQKEVVYNEGLAGRLFPE